MTVEMLESEPETVWRRWNRVPTDPPRAAEKQRTLIDLALLALIAISIAATQLSGGVVRAVIVLAAMLLVPGGAVITRIGPFELLPATALAITISVALETVFSMVAVWLHIWHPFAIAAILAVGAAGAIIFDLSQLRRAQVSTAQTAAREDAVRPSGRLQLGLLALLVVAVALWAASLGPVKIASLGTYGLIPALPVSWYLALALLVCGAAIALTSRRSSAWLTAAFVIAVVVVLYATIPAIAHEPQYTWVYKHIGVTRYIEVHGRVNPNLDIYNRWAGFFALAATFAKLSGVTDPTAFAGWAEPMFALLDALLVAAIAHTFVRDRRVVALSALLFSAFDWVGQSYFSPQASAFLLGLGLTLVISRLLLERPAQSQRVVRVAERLLRSKTRQTFEPAAPSGWKQPSTIAVIVLVDVAIVFIHELSPYVIALQVASLAVLGLLRPRWIAVALFVLPIAFLLPNLTFVQVHEGLFSNLNPFHNIASATTYGGAPLAGVALDARAGELLGVLSWLGAVAATVLLVRRGLGRRALCLIVLAFSPFIVVLVQNYGGEVGLRLVLFSAAASATLIAMMTLNMKRPILRGALTLGLITVAVGLFVPAFFGNEEINLVPKSEVAASNYIYNTAPAGSTLLMVDGDFPARVSARYSVFRSYTSGADPDLLTYNQFLGRPLGAQSIPALLRVMRTFSNPYLAFSQTGDQDAVNYGKTPPGALQDLREAVARSDKFVKVFVRPGAWVYKLKHPALVSRSAA